MLPLTKILAFDIIRSLLFGLEQGARKDRFVTCFQEMIEGVWSIPINLPFTRYNSSLKASAKVRNMVKELIREKRVELRVLLLAKTLSLACLVAAMRTMKKQ